MEAQCSKIWNIVKAVVRSLEQYKLTSENKKNLKPPNLNLKKLGKKIRKLKVSTRKGKKKKKKKRSDMK